MFGMSMTEVAIVVILALILLGPDRLPGAVRSLGKTLRVIREATSGIRETIDSELRALDEPSSTRAEPTPVGDSASLAPGVPGAAGAPGTVALVEGSASAPGLATKEAPGAPASPGSAATPPVTTRRPALADMRSVSLADLGALRRPAQPAPAAPAPGGTDLAAPDGVRPGAVEATKSE